MAKVKDPAKVKIGRSSRQKGKRFERALAEQLREMFNLTKDECHRGQQFRGGADSPDVVGLNGIHIEAKFVEKLNLYDAVAQSIKDSGKDEVPVVIHKKSRVDTLITLRLKDLIQFVDKMKPYTELEEDNGSLSGETGTVHPDSGDSGAEAGLQTISESASSS